MTSTEVLINVTNMETAKAFIKMSISLAPSGGHYEKPVFRLSGKKNPPKASFCH